MLNQERIELLISELLKQFDPNPNRPGLAETPKRVAKYWCELLEGQLYTNDQIAEMYDKCFEDVENGDLVLEKDITIFSMFYHYKC